MIIMTRSEREAKRKCTLQKTLIYQTKYITIINLIFNMMF